MAIFLLDNTAADTFININDYYFCILYNISVCFSAPNMEGKEQTAEFFRIVFSSCHTDSIPLPDTNY